MISQTLIYLASLASPGSSVDEELELSAANVIGGESARFCKPLLWVEVRSACALVASDQIIALTHPKQNGSDILAISRSMAR